MRLLEGQGHRPNKLLNSSRCRLIKMMIWGKGIYKVMPYNEKKADRLGKRIKLL